MKPSPLTMPQWPAYLLAVGAAACALPAMTMPHPRGEGYRALGQEPGWNLVIDGRELRYVGDYGETRITVPRPEPVPTAHGHRYVSPRLSVDVIDARCNDSMSGHGYQHQVVVSADGRTVRGCGGERRSDWDV